MGSVSTHGAPPLTVPTGSQMFAMSPFRPPGPHRPRRSRPTGCAHLIPAVALDAHVLLCAELNLDEPRGRRR